MIKNILGVILFIFWGVFGIFASLIISVLILLLAPILKGKTLRKVFVKLWAKYFFYASFSGVKRYNFSKTPKEAVIIITNHQSGIDILVAAGFFPKDFLFLSKKEVFSIPIVGQAMKKVGFIPVDRKSLRQAAQSVVGMVKKVREGNSILIYPEGTRNDKDDSILPLKSGFMAVAAKSEAPILPIIVYDTKQIYSGQRSFRISPRKLKINVLDKIDIDDKIHPANQKSKLNDHEKLKRIHEMMQQAFDELS